MGIEDLGQDDEALVHEPIPWEVQLLVEHPFDLSLLGDGLWIVHELTDLTDARLEYREIRVAEDHLGQAEGLRG